MLQLAQSLSMTHNTRMRPNRIALAGTLAALAMQAASGLQSPPADFGPRPRAVKRTPVETPHGREFFVAPGGSADGDGSRDRPWDLATALAAPKAVTPGDTIWVRAGKYGEGGAHAVLRSRLLGAPSAPIVVRAWPGDRAILDAWLQVGCCEGDPKPAEGGWVWFRDLEFAGFNPDRTSGRSGPPDYTAMANHAGADSWAPATRFIDCIVHDTSGGLSLWQESTDAEAYGNLIYFVGGQGPDRGHGHGLYVQNDAGVKHLTDNIVFDNFGNGFHGYASSQAAIRNLAVEGNAVFNNGGIANTSSASDNFLFAGGRDGVDGLQLVANFTYFTRGIEGYNEIGYPWSMTNGNAVIADNYFVGGFDPLDLWRWRGLEIRHNLFVSEERPALSLKPASDSHDYRAGRNVYYGSGAFTLDGAGKDWPHWREATGMDSDSRYAGARPSGVAIAVRPNRYEHGRANIVIYNWDNAPSVRVDVSGVLDSGAAFEIRDAQNFFGPPVVRGVYRNAPLEIPLTGLTAAQPNGTVPRPAVHTAPEFAVFVLRTATGK
jgi:hypothetical protein